MISSVVIDTNVLVAANDNSDPAGPNCVLACVSALEDAKANKLTLIDSGMCIFEEYRRHANHSGRPGLGDAFFKWLWNNQANLNHCEQVEITPISHDLYDFEEFPDDPDLAGFDRSDRKFVAVAKASRKRPTILNATDSDWWNFRVPLEANGLRIKFLCPGLFR